MSFKDYIQEHQDILDEYDNRLDEMIVKKKRIETVGGSQKVKTVYVDTDPNYKVVHHKNGTVERRRITQEERNNLQKRKGVKGSKNRKQQKKSLKKHYELLGGPERNDPNGIGKGDVVYRRTKNQKVLSDEKAAAKRKRLADKKERWKRLKDAIGNFANKVGNVLNGGPKKIWNG